MATASKSPTKGWTERRNEAKIVTANPVPIQNETWDDIPWRMKYLCTYSDRLGSAFSACWSDATRELLSCKHVACDSGCGEFLTCWWRLLERGEPCESVILCIQLFRFRLWEASFVLQSCVLVVSIRDCTSWWKTMIVLLIRAFPNGGTLAYFSKLWEPNRDSLCKSGGTVLRK